MHMKKQRNNNDPSFNIWAFKNWFEKQPDIDTGEIPSYKAKKVYGNLTGHQVESRLGIDRLKKQVIQHNENLDKHEAECAAIAFKEEGGNIVEMDDLKLIIEAGDYRFYLPKIYTKMLED